MRLLKGADVLMKNHKPSGESVKAYKAWSDAVEELYSLESRMAGEKFNFSRDPSPEQLARKASLEAKIKELDPVVDRAFPL